jgi:hypothetical protein
VIATLRIGFFLGKGSAGREGIGLAVIAVSLCLLLASAGPLRAQTHSAESPSELEERLLSLQTRLLDLQPKGNYVIIDTVSNRLYLKKGNETLLEAVCSTGSGRRLITDVGDWTFKTPKGKFRIRNKVSNPVWRKPDWAFAEKGLPIPENDGERFVRGALGDWALGLGDGYFIHGTPYTRLLGQSVSHGCIRLHNRDLSFLAEHVKIGDLVYIF